MRAARIEMKTTWKCFRTREGAYRFYVELRDGQLKPWSNCQDVKSENLQGGDLPDVARRAWETAAARLERTLPYGVPGVDTSERPKLTELPEADLTVEGPGDSCPAAAGRPGDQGLVDGDVSIREF